jgi:hypothetical protein
MGQSRNEEWTIQRPWQHWVHKTPHDEDKQKTKLKKILDIHFNRKWLKYCIIFTEPAIQS